MTLSRFLLAAGAALLLSTSAFAQDAPAGPGSHGGMMMHGMFTPEERMMMFSDGFKATSGMTDDQRHAYRQQQRERLMAMSDTDRAKYKADLDARWNALPADQKGAIKAKVEAFMASHQRPAAQ
ncbi:MAG: hypothetical protein WDM91_02295 [Rhizomicrobium sp.]